MKQNLCRICGQCFCCKKCRFRHEDAVHHVHPECDICVYGRCNLNNFSNSLLVHIKEKHLPVHCLRCKQVFLTTDDLISHDSCVVKIKRKKIFADSTIKINYDTLPTMANIHKSILKSSDSNYNRDGNVTTSTPMQNNTRDMMLNNIQEVITPVDSMKNNDDVRNFNSVFKRRVTPCISEQSKNCEETLKGRVSFVETPADSTSNQISETQVKHLYSGNLVITPVDSTKNNNNVKNLNSVLTPCISEQSKNGEGTPTPRVTPCISELSKNSEGTPIPRVTPCISEQSENGEETLKRRVSFVETPTAYTNKKTHSTSNQISGTPEIPFHSGNLAPLRRRLRF